MTADLKEKDDLIKEHNISLNPTPASAFMTQGTNAEEGREF